jgi:hypothetical protein
MNGHVVNKKRGLTDKEKEALKKLFLSCDGIIKNDMTAQMKASVGKDVSIFQVTGAIVTFHRQVAKGEIVLKDPKAYKAFMDARRAKWASYKSDRYKKYKTRLIKGKKVPAKVLKAVAKAKPVPKIAKKPKVSKVDKKALEMKHTKPLTANPIFKKTHKEQQVILVQEMAKMRTAMDQFYESALLILNSLKTATK